MTSSPQTTLVTNYISSHKTVHQGLRKACAQRGIRGYVAVYLYFQKNRPFHAHLRNHQYLRGDDLSPDDFDSQMAEFINNVDWSHIQALLNRPPAEPAKQASEAPCRLTPWTVGSLKKALDNLDPRLPITMQTTDDGTLRMQPARWNPHGNAWEPYDGFPSTEDVCFRCVGCVPRGLEPAPEDVPRVPANRCIRDEMTELLLRTRDLLSTPRWPVRRSVHGADVRALDIDCHPVPAISSKAHYFNLTGALSHAIHTSDYHDTDVPHATRHCLFTAASAIGYPDPDADDPAHDQQANHDCNLAIIDTALEWTLQYAESDWQHARQTAHPPKS